MKQQEKYDIDYNVLKSNIIKSCRGTETGSVEFTINYNKLSKLLDDLGLIVINVGTKSKPVKPDNIVNISEYFKAKKLSWFNECRDFTQLIFVKSDSMDDKLKDLINYMNSDQIDNPDIDKVYTLAEIVAEYPCYFATVVSYLSNDPTRFNKPSYIIACRANTVSILQENYKYNEKDMS